MTNEELVYLYQNGDRNALGELTEKNKGIVNKLANKFYTERTSSIDKEDLEQEGYIGLIIAADKYDLNNPKKASFITYAIHWIYQRINNFVRSKNTNDETSLNAPVGSDESDIELMDTLGEQNNIYENVEDKMYIMQLRKELESTMNESLTLKEIEIIKLHFGWDNNKIMTLLDIGDMFGVTRTAIGNIEHKAFAKMRRTSWGIEKGKEIYREKSLQVENNTLSVVEKVAFAQKYFSEVL